MGLELSFKIGKTGEGNMLFPMTALLIGDSESWKIKVVEKVRLNNCSYKIFFAHRGEILTGIQCVQVRVLSLLI